MTDRPSLRVIEGGAERVPQAPVTVPPEIAKQLAHWLFANLEEQEDSIAMAEQLQRRTRALVELHGMLNAPLGQGLVAAQQVPLSEKAAAFRAAFIEARDALLRQINGQ